ncbi:MAG: response regulator transcription factor [Halobacteriovoraceae bacterium]|nr:response regulator transcription factor [Halobacteriovoraceae bacterium]
MLGKLDQNLTLFFLALLALMTGFDIIDDLKEGVAFKHCLHEIIIVLAAVSLILYKIVIAWKIEKRARLYQQQMRDVRLEVDFYKNKIAEFKQGLSSILEQQFKLWGLTESESDVALLLIQGLSMKEVAESRGSSEVTVRQQASSIYKKSKLENRHQLVSYFLEDLFSF